MNDIDTHIQRVLDAIETRRHQQEARIAATPATQLCLDCGGEALLDHESLFDDFGRESAPQYVCIPCTSRQKAERQRKRLVRLGLPADALHATLANFQTSRPEVNPQYNTPEQFLDACRQFRIGKVRNLILAGSVGIGKGHLAAALAAETLNAGRLIRWVDCSRLFRDYHAAYADRSNERVIAPLIAADLLVIDEVCLRKLPEDGEEILFAILDPRHKSRRRTILLGNQPAAATRTWLGERIRDRLTSGGLAFCYGEWQSMRGGEHDNGGF